MKTKRIISLALCALVAASSLSFGAAAAGKKLVKSIKVQKKATITIPADKKTVSKTFKVTVKVSGKASQKFSAKSSKKAVASVKAGKGKIKVTAKKAGKTVITLTTKAKGKKGKKLKAKFTVTVKKAKAPEVIPETPTEAPTQAPTEATEAPTAAPTTEEATTVTPSDPVDTTVTEPTSEEATSETTAPSEETQAPTDASETAKPEETTQAPTEETKPSEEATTQAPENDEVKFYYAPSKEQLDSKSTFKFNYCKADGKWAQVNMTLSSVTTPEGSAVYEASVPKADAVGLKVVQFQTYDEKGEKWLSQVELKDAEIAASAGTVVKSDGTTDVQPTEPVQDTTSEEGTKATDATQAPTEKPTEATQAPTEKPTEAPTEKPTEATQAPTQAPTTDPEGWDPHIYQP